MTVVAALAGFLASLGIRLVPAIPRSTAPCELVLLALLGLGAGVAAWRRGEQVDAERWRIVQQPELTSGEREYAHKEAERERRLAATAFLAAPLALGYWAAYQVAPGPGALADLAPVGALAGFFAGYLGCRLTGR